MEGFQMKERKVASSLFLVTSTLPIAFQSDSIPVDFMKPVLMEPSELSVKLSVKWHGNVTYHQKPHRLTAVFVHPMKADATHLRLKGKSDFSSTLGKENGDVGGW